MMTTILFSAPWCSPCKTVKQEIEKLGASVEVVDISKDSTTPLEFGIKSVPTIVDKKNPIRRLTGTISRDMLRDWFSLN